MLHSALGSANEFDALRQYYPDRNVLIPDLPSYGKSPASHPSLTTNILADETSKLLRHLEIGSVDIIGYSMGGYVALELALMYTSQVRSIVSHSMKFYWTPQAIKDAVTGLDPEILKERSPKAYEKLSAIHSAMGLEETMRYTRTIIENFSVSQLTSADMMNVKCPLLISTGDRDDLVPPEEAAKLYESLDKKKTYLAIQPNSPHQLNKLDMASFTHSVREFWKTT